MRVYSEQFKAKMVAKVLAPPGRSAFSVARDAGMSQPTLSRWVRAAGKVAAVSRDSESRRPADWTPAEKLAAVVEASRLSGEELGSFLRRKGLHEEDLKAWRAQAEGAFEVDRATPRRSASDKKRIDELERKLSKAEKKLRAADAIIELQKKVRAMWADEDGDTAEKSDDD